MPDPFAAYQKPAADPFAAYQRPSFSYPDNLPGLHKPSLPDELLPDSQQYQSFWTSPHGLIRSGLRQAAHGVEAAAEPGMNAKMGGASQVIRGLGKAATPAMIPIAAMNPVSAIGGAVGAGIGGAAGGGLAHVLGASPEGQDLATDLSALAGGGWASQGRGLATMRGAASGAMKPLTEPLTIHTTGKFGDITLPPALSLLVHAPANVLKAGLPIAIGAGKGAVQGYKGYRGPWTPPVFAEPDIPPPRPVLPQRASPEDVFRSMGRNENYTEPGPIPNDFIKPVAAEPRVRPQWEGLPNVQMAGRSSVAPIEPIPSALPSGRVPGRPGAEPLRPVTIPEPDPGPAPAPGPVSAKPGSLIYEDIPARYSQEPNPRAAYQKDQTVAKYLKEKGITPEQLEQSNLQQVNSWVKEAGKNYKVFRPGDPNVARRLSHLATLLRGE